MLLKHYFKVPSENDTESQKMIAGLLAEGTVYVIAAGQNGPALSTGKPSVTSSELISSLSSSSRVVLSEQQFTKAEADLDSSGHNKGATVTLRAGLK